MFIFASVWGNDYLVFHHMALYNFTLNLNLVVLKARITFTWFAIMNATHKTSQRSNSKQAVSVWF
ncbi:hypothetical protein PULV_b0073 [Pseudoalteromonas ulvae UL12]|nr:hypothetical protein [Pseudoalteromonas ulvae UL12]